MSDINNPHDAFAKDLLSDPEAAVEVLRLALSPEAFKLLDVSHIERIPGSWVSDDLKQHFGDVLYRVGLANSPDAPLVDLYILFEHKSAPDRLVSVQLLKYMVLHWLHHLTINSIPLPVVIPLVLYHGERQWTGDTQFQALFGKPAEALLKYIPRFDFALLNLPDRSREEFSGPARVRLGLDVLRAFFRSDLVELLPEILRTLPENDATAVEYLEKVFTYLSCKLHEDELTQALTAAFPNESSPIMLSIFQKHHDKGLAEGREEGRCSVLLRQILRKYGKQAQVEFAEDLTELTVADLDQLAEDLLDFSNVEDLRQWLKNRRS